VIIHRRKLPHVAADAHLIGNHLYLPKVGALDVAVELARHIREQFAARYRRAA